MAKEMKNWYVSRTILLAVAQGIVGVIIVILSETPEIKGAGGLAIVKSILDAFLRMDTNKEIE